MKNRADSPAVPTINANRACLRSAGRAGPDDERDWRTALLIVRSPTNRSLLAAVSPLAARVLRPVAGFGEPGEATRFLRTGWGTASPLSSHRVTARPMAGAMMRRPFDHVETGRRAECVQGVPQPLQLVDSGRRLVVDASDVDRVAGGLVPAGRTVDEDQQRKTFARRSRLGHVETQREAWIHAARHPRREPGIVWMEIRSVHWPASLPGVSGGSVPDASSGCMQCVTARPRRVASPQCRYRRPNATGDDIHVRAEDDSRGPGRYAGTEATGREAQAPSPAGLESNLWSDQYFLHSGTSRPGAPMVAKTAGSSPSVWDTLGDRRHELVDEVAVGVLDHLGHEVGADGLAVARRA